MEHLLGKEEFTHRWRSVRLHRSDGQTCVVTQEVWDAGGEGGGSSLTWRVIIDKTR